MIMLSMCTMGRYLGVETLEVGDVHRDYIKLQYKGIINFVPVDQNGSSTKICCFRR